MGWAMLIKRSSFSQTATDIIPSQSATAFPLIAKPAPPPPNTRKKLSPLQNRKTELTIRSNTHCPSQHRLNQIVKYHPHPITHYPSQNRPNAPGSPLTVPCPRHPAVTVSRKKRYLARRITGGRSALSPGPGSSAAHKKTTGQDKAHPFAQYGIYFIDAYTAPEHPLPAQLPVPVDGSANAITSAGGADFWRFCR
jgi:hypothetical protein